MRRQFARRGRHPHDDVLPRRPSATTIASTPVAHSNRTATAVLHRSLEAASLLGNAQMQRMLANASPTADLQRQPAKAPDAGAPSSLPTIPGLGPTRTAAIDAKLKASDFQGALDLLVNAKAADGAIDKSLLENSQMLFSPTTTAVDAATSMPSWDYINNKADPSKVKVGPSAFSSISYLYSVIMHEYQHVLHRQTLQNQQTANANQGHGGMYTGEVEAYAWELLHATETGLDKEPAKIASIWGHLNEEYWKLDPAAQKAMKSKATQALAAAQKAVKGTKDTLDPFKAPQP